ncbi:hypothetical protein Ait01nite_012600 [Actinoplanes italicus]|uniref:Uncharacterized protein n=1 Tax=Actinoplanes italicus TaxID=113567 RepID=A0A2T0KGX2_9ACTN|nr:hypothetical protein [Actinoplanes italicus]PRX22694.1 hypothetical protein CLV67_104222 [Actinoplanes italicus]GIE28215.1 hypothetical protein Ait01nite_012600 [Actinoplanes italicus]
MSADGDYEEHILLTARSLRYCGSMTYPHSMQQNAIRPAATPGRWLTCSDDVLELGELDDTSPHATVSALFRAGRTEISGPQRGAGLEEIPGQLGLFQPS